MSDLTAENLAVLVRRRMHLPETAVLRIQPLITDGLSKLAPKVAQDAQLRQYMMTPLSTTTVSLTAGVADLSTLIETGQILLDYIRCGEIYHPSSSYPLQWVNTPAQGQLPNRFDKLFYTAWLIGKFLHVKTPTRAAAMGTLSLAVPFQATLAQLDNQLNTMLEDKIIELFTESPRDYAEDAAK